MFGHGKDTQKEHILMIAKYVHPLSALNYNFEGPLNDFFVQLKFLAKCNNVKD